MHSTILRQAILLLTLLLIVGVDTTARAEQPFFYYPAYGAQRGKIKYVDGIFRNKQKVHWGNGLTDNGVAFFHDAFAAATTIVPAVVGKRDAEPSDSEKRAASRAAAFDAEDRTRQSEAESLLERNQALLARLGGAAESTPEKPTPAKPSGPRKDNFEDWPDDKTPAKSESPAKGKDRFEDWKD